MRSPRPTTDDVSQTTYASLLSGRLDPSRRLAVDALRLDGGRLRNARVRLGFSQVAFADAIRAAGVTIGEPNGCTKRAAQKWESGGVAMPRPHLRRALEVVTKMPFAEFCAQASPPGPGPAAAELSEIAADMSDLIYRLVKVRGHLASTAPPVADY